MGSGMIFKNPDKPANHKPMITAGAVVAYNLLKSKDSKPDEDTKTITNHSSNYFKDNLGPWSIVLAILSPVIAMLIGVLTNAEIGFISIPAILLLCVVMFICALFTKD
jgi:uncharacterized Tic20 family protein